MALNKIQLGSLDFDSIKNSIIDHLKSQDVLKDYDYSGSVAQVLLDILAYNTLYYGFYTNMVANEMFLDTAQKTESIISLVKPLGFVVPGKTSSTATIKVQNVGCDSSNNFIPKFTRFTGYNSQGIPYNFYNTTSVYLDLSGCETVLTLVEGKKIYKEVPLVVDHTTKKGFINGTDIDITTIVVEVYDSTIIPETGKEVGWVQWSRASNMESTLDKESKVYWLERSEFGFFVIFGGAYGDSVFSQVGKEITENDRIRITYLKSNGSVGDRVSSFSSNDIGGSVTTLSSSSGGQNEPNLEAIRFFAPKWFAAQNRAVTVEDCRSVLVNAGFVGDSVNPYSKFNVWGGEKMDPPRYGRVFVSLSDDYQGDFNAQATAIRVLEEKTCVSILPEFLAYKSYDFSLRGMVRYNPGLTTHSEDTLLGMINEKITSLYPSKFEQRINLANLVNEINQIDPSLEAAQNDIVLYISTYAPPSNIKTTHQFKTPCEPGTLFSEKFVAHSSIEVDSPDRKLLLKTKGEVVGGYQKVVAYYYWNNSIEIEVASAGRFQPSSGKLELNSNISAETINIRVVPKSGSFSASENMFTKINTIDLSLSVN